MEELWQRRLRVGLQEQLPPGPPHEPLRVRPLKTTPTAMMAMARPKNIVAATKVCIGSDAHRSARWAAKEGVERLSNFPGALRVMK